MVSPGEDQAGGPASGIDAELSNNMFITVLSFNLDCQTPFSGGVGRFNRPTFRRRQKRMIHFIPAGVL